MAENIDFLGTGWAFPPEFNKDKASVEMSSDEDDIKSSLQILLSTTLGERILQPTYGCNLRDYLFEPIDTSMKTFLTDLITKAILYFEPRILLEKTEINVKNEEGYVQFLLTYTIKTTNSRYNFVYPFYLNEGSGVI